MPYEFITGNNNKCYLTESEGDTKSLAEIPDILEKPLIIAEEGKIEGYKSGRRSAIIIHKGTAYKLKGCNPKPGQIWTNGEPDGTNSKERMLNEFNITEKINEYLKSKNIQPPLIPIGYYEYNDNEYCGLFRTNGEMRLSSVLVRLYELENLEAERKKSFIKKIIQWVGFSQYVLNECSIEPSNTWNTFESNNMVIHEIKNGYGLTRIDHNYSQISTEHRDQINDVTEKSVDDIISEHLYKTDNRYIDITDEIQRINKILKDKNNITFREEMMSAYKEALNGRIPEPLDYDIIYEIAKQNKYYQTGKTIWDIDMTNPEELKKLIEI